MTAKVGKDTPPGCPRLPHPVSPPQPATLCRPQPEPTHQRAQQSALLQSTADSARNLFSQPNIRAISSPPSQTASAAPTAAVVQCSRSQSQAVELRAVTSKQGVVPPEVAAAAASMAAASAPPAHPPSPLFPRHLCKSQTPSNFPSCRTAAAAAPAAATVQFSHSQSHVLGLRAVTHIWPRPLPFPVPEVAVKCLPFASVVRRNWGARGEVASTRE